MRAPTRRLADRYELLEPIGTGGMATVWRALDTRLGREVAVKVLRPDLAADPELVARFDQEARYAASLAHENIAAVYDTGHDGDARFIVMELVPGPSVAELLARHGPLAPGQAVRIAAASARALAAAHARGVVHRDVKPGNIIVGLDGRVRLTDFGIARALEEARHTNPGTLVGSIPYLSPGRLHGESGGPSDDLYALGVVLFEMLTGRLPGPGTGGARGGQVGGATGPRHPEPASAPPEPPSPSVPADLRPIVDQLLASHPVRRPSSARAAAAMLEQWSGRHPGSRPAAGNPVAAAWAAGPPAWAVASIEQQPGPSPTPPSAPAGGPFPVASGTPSSPAGQRPTSGASSAAGSPSVESGPTAKTGRRPAVLAPPVPPVAPPPPPATVRWASPEGPDPATTRAPAERRTLGLPATVRRAGAPSAGARDATARGRATGPTTRPRDGTPTRLGAAAAAGARGFRQHRLPALAVGGAMLSLLVLAIVLVSASGPSGLRLREAGSRAAPVSPLAAAQATPSATPPPTPAASPTPPLTGATPAPTTAPTAAPVKATPPAGVKGGRAATRRAVADFYAAVAAHDWQRAIALWSPAMRKRYPPDQWLIGRFRPTTAIRIERLRTTSYRPSKGTAVVAVTLVESRDDGTKRTISGSWVLRRYRGAWLLDQPRF